MLGMQVGSWVISFGVVRELSGAYPRDMAMPETRSRA